MKKILVIVLLMSTIMLTGCDLFKKEDGKVKSCPDCVYDYYYLMDHAWDDENAVGNKVVKYDKDYKNLKDENGNQRDIFLGYKIDKEEKIEKIYVCIMNNNKPICIEGSKDGSTYESNTKILKESFNDCELDTENSEKLICNDGKVAAFKSGFVGVANDKIICKTDTTDGYCVEIEDND